MYNIYRHSYTPHTIHCSHVHTHTEWSVPNTSRRGRTFRPIVESFHFVNRLTDILNQNVEIRS